MVMCMDLRIIFTLSRIPRMQLKTSSVCTVAEAQLSLIYQCIVNCPHFFMAEKHVKESFANIASICAARNRITFVNEMGNR